MADAGLKSETKLFLQERQYQAMVVAYQRELPAQIRTYATRFARAYAAMERNSKPLRVATGGAFKLPTTGWTNNLAEGVESVTQTARGVESEMKSGCSELQTKTLEVLRRAMAEAIRAAKQGYPRVEEYWKVDSVGAGLSTKIFAQDVPGVGSTVRIQVPFHNAVRVKSKLSGRTLDVVFDPWITLTPMIYTLSQWQRKEQAGAHWQKD